MSETEGSEDASALRPSETEVTDTSTLGEVENESLEAETGEEISASEREGEEFLGPDTSPTRAKLSDIEEIEEDELELSQNQYLFDESGDFDEEVEDTAFLSRYDEEFAGEVDMDEDIVPPRVPLTAQSLEEMIRLLESQEEVETNDSDEFFLPHPQSECIADAPKEAEHQEEPEEAKVVVLGPDHPRMQRFQEALKRHLLRQIFAEKCEARDLEVELKTRRKEREELGEQMYNLEYELSRQSELIERQEQELHELMEKRAAVDAATEEASELRDRAEAELRKEMQEESRLMRATKEMDLMEWCIREAIRDYEGQLQISQRVDERFQKLKIKAEVEKRDQDVYLDRLMLRLQQTEQSNESFQRQIEAHSEEQKELNCFIAEASAEIEALQIEKAHLQRAWNETIGVVRSRDEALNAARRTLETTEEEFKMKETEIKQLLRAITKEQENHEKVTVRLKRRKMEERHLKSRLAGLEAQLAELQGNLAMLNQLREQVNQEFARGTNEKAGLNKLLDPPRQRMQKLLAEKKRLEDEILGIIQEQTAMDNVAQGIAKQIRAAREKTRNCEDEMAKVESDLTRTNYECEVLRTDLMKKNLTLAELERKLKAEEDLLQIQNNQMKYSERILNKKNNEVQQLTTKLQKLEKEQDDLGIGRMEEEVQELEKQVAHNRTLCVDLQEKWLKLQDELVTLSAKRDEILDENELRRKEEFVLERKRQRLQLENETKQGEIQKIQRLIRLAQIEIDSLNSKLFEGKEEQEALEKDNFLLQTELINILKDAELEVIELQDEIMRLEVDKDRLSKELAEAHEQCLIWEKKVKMAKEIKSSIKTEQENSMTQLKLAIHHMQVRHNDLRRVQEKIMLDMERCIEKRERIIQQADYNLKKHNLHPNSLLLHVQRDEVNVKNKRRKILQEAKEAEAEVKRVEDNISQLEGKIKCETEGLRKIKKIIDAAEEKLSEAAIEKHKNLIEVILRQIKFKILESVNLKRFQAPANPKQVADDIKKLEERCYAIVELCDVLLEEYPEYKLPIKLIKASILPNVQ